MGRLDALRAALEQRHPKHPFGLGNRPRHRRLGNRQNGGGLGHAARIRDGDHAFEMTELEAASNMRVVAMPASDNLRV
jgi:hypothetical protein